MTTEKKLWDTLLALNNQKLLVSAHDLSEGGLWVSLVEKALPKRLGFDVQIESKLRADFVLFGETQSRVLVTVKPEKLAALQSAVQGQLPFAVLGKVTKANLRCEFNGQTLIDDAAETHFQPYETGFQKAVFTKS